MHWSQIQTILWLRWRLTRNQWARGGRVSVAISFVVMALLLVIGVGGGVAGLLAGVLGLKGGAPPVLLAVYDGLTILFLLFWCIGILSTIQRSESVDIGKLLHLPVSLKSVFLVNYLASHVTLSIIVFLPAMLFLAVGLALGGHVAMLLMVPLVLGFLFAVTAWTYHLRGWLVILMRNPRRYRAVVAIVTMSFVLLCQLPNLFNFTFLQGRHARARTPAQTEAQTQAEGEQRPDAGIPRVVLLVHKLVPPLWVGQGAMSLREGHPAPAALAALALFGVGALGLSRAYRSTVRFYEGRTVQKKARAERSAPRKAAAPAGGCLLERRVPGLPQDAATVMLASLQSLRRATEVKMALAYNVVMIIVFAGTAMLSHSRDYGFRMQLFYATGMALLPFLGMLYLMTNQFGLDRSAFRTLVLSPMSRAHILLGKNLALLPTALALGLVYLALAALGLRLGAVIILAAVVQLVAAFFLANILGNVVSSLLPFRIREGSLGQTKVGAGRALLSFLAHLICMAILSLLFLPALVVFLAFGPEGLVAQLAYMFLSIVELAIIVTVYSLSLFGLGELLQSREKEILRIVTQEVE